MVGYTLRQTNRLKSFFSEVQGPSGEYDSSNPVMRYRVPLPTVAFVLHRAVSTCLPPHPPPPRAPETLDLVLFNRDTHSPLSAVHDLGVRNIRNQVAANERRPLHGDAVDCQNMRVPDGCNETYSVQS